jgi:hypothetical protein
LAEPGAGVYLLVNPAEMEGQWREMPMGASYRWLRDGPGLSPLGQWEGYTLFLVGPP